MSMTDADNTNMSGGSTPMGAENTRKCVENVLELGKRRRYRKNMTKNPTGAALIGILPEHFSEAFRRSPFGSREKLAEHIRLTQKVEIYYQAVGRVLMGESENSIYKYPVAKALQPWLWQVALEKNNTKLKRELMTHGLQPNDDDAMTTSRDDRAVRVGPEYSFDLFEPSLARGEDSVMVFPEYPSAKIKPPTTPHSPESYAIRMIGDMMRPRYENGEVLDVDPSIEPVPGEYCFFLNASRSRSRIGKLISIEPEMWRTVQRPETRFEEGFDLSRTEWPICEVIIASRRK
jgi:SOS-response transcriptional repressor LexA